MRKLSSWISLHPSLDSSNIAVHIASVQTPPFSIATPDGRGESRAALPASAEVILPAPIGEVTLEAHRSLASAEREWRTFESRAAGHPYQCFDWLAVWNAHIRRPDVQPFIVVLRDREGVRMLLPFVIERVWGIVRLAPMGSPVCDYHAALVDPQFAKDLGTESAHRVLMAIAALADADYVLLTHVPPMLGAVRNPFSALALHAFSASHGTALGRDWESYYARRRSAKTRSRYRAKEKALAKTGVIEFSEVTEPQQRAALAEQMVALKAAQLTPAAGAFNAFAQPQVQEFFVALARQRDNDAFVFKLTVGGVLAAAVLCLVRNDCVYYEFPVYPDHALKRFSPGYLLLTRLMEWAIGRGCARFDFTVGDEAYKAEWCDETWALGCGACPRTVRGRIGAAIALAAIAGIREVKKRPAFYGVVVRVRTLLGRFRQAFRAAHL